MTHYQLKKVRNPLNQSFENSCVINLLVLSFCLVRTLSTSLGQTLANNVVTFCLFFTSLQDIWWAFLVLFLSFLILIFIENKRIYPNFIYRLTSGKWAEKVFFKPMPGHRNTWSKIGDFHWISLWADSIGENPLPGGLETSGRREYR